MSLAPYLAETTAVQLHLAVVLLAFVLGAWVLFRAKGTPVHKRLGRIWMGLMAAASISSFFIPATLVPLYGGFGVIHLLSVWVLINIGIAVWAARTGRIRQHRIWVTATYVGALIGAGAGAMVPGRLISQMLGYG
ncbi:DUF2306 domain-containing protein [Desertibaculum subflavum]|uniref:DUF2306 domain-containing protein n=1 Tax=Desertibaculum subflavum TaxID=2268458 RepID=UPI000E67133C